MKKILFLLSILSLSCEEKKCSSLNRYVNLDKAIYYDNSFYNYFLNSIEGSIKYISLYHYTSISRDSMEISFHQYKDKFYKYNEVLDSNRYSIREKINCSSSFEEISMIDYDSIFMRITDSLAEEKKNICALGLPVFGKDSTVVIVFISASNFDGESKVSGRFLFEYDAVYETWKKVDKVGIISTYRKEPPPVSTKNLEELQSKLEKVINIPSQE